MFALIVPGARNVIFFALCTSAVIFGVSAALLTGVGPFGRISKFSNVFHSRISVYSRLCGGELVAQERWQNSAGLSAKSFARLHRRALKRHGMMAF